MTSPAVSVIVPTYDRRAVVTEAIESVLAQTLTDFELLVVDDGSRDGTTQMLAAAYGHERRLRILERPNGGVGAARNTGIQAARAPRLAYLDSDDVWAPGFLESQMEVLEREGADLVVCDAAYVGMAERGADHLLGDPSFRPPLSMQAMLDGAWGLPSTMLVRAEVARALPFDEVLPSAQDLEWLFRFHAGGYRCTLNEARLASWRQAGVARMTDCDDAQRLLQVRLRWRYARYAQEPRVVRDGVYVDSRHRARALVSEGR